MRTRSEEQTSRPPRQLDAPADFDDRTVGVVGRHSMVGAAAGSLGLGTLVALGSLAASAEVGQAMGVAAAVALTGGPFFGGLVGFAVAVHAAEAEASRAKADPAAVAGLPVPA